MRAQQKPGAPVVGFNHNIPYKGRTFHVQTEDSGPQHAHIITHIFLGGNILASTKSLYTDIATSLSGSKLFDAVRKRMEEQHKAMIRELVHGKHDEEIARRGSGTYEPGVLAGGAKAPDLLVGGDRSASEPEPTPESSSLSGLFDAPAFTPLDPAPAAVTTAVPPAPRLPSTGNAGRRVGATPVPPARGRPGQLPRRPSASSATSTPGPGAPIPVSLGTSKTAFTPPSPVQRSSPTPPPPTRAPAPRSSRQAALPRRQRQAPGANEPVLFGDDLVSDRRLDEVILNYLATDSGGSEKKRDG